MRTIKVNGADALRELDQFRREWKESGDYPFLIGDDHDLQELQESVETPSDGGAESRSKAESFNVVQWLASGAPKGGKAWPKQESPPLRYPNVLYDLVTRHRKPEIHIGLIPARHSWDVFANLGFGGWNDCPEPHIHVALHKYWSETYKVSPVSISGDVVECFVLAPPTEQKNALALAREQYTYCYDIVEQGHGSIGKLGSSLLNGKFWGFWWD